MVLSHTITLVAKTKITRRNELQTKLWSVFLNKQHQMSSSFTNVKTGQFPHWYIQPVFMYTFNNRTMASQVKQVFTWKTMGEQAKFSHLEKSLTNKLICLLCKKGGTIIVSWESYENPNWTDHCLTTHGKPSQAVWPHTHQKPNWTVHNHAISEHPSRIFHQLEKPDPEATWKTWLYISPTRQSWKTKLKCLRSKDDHAVVLVIKETSLP